MTASRGARRAALAGVAIACALLPARSRGEEPPLARLTDTPRIAERQPAWSPDGAWIACAAADSSGRTDLWLVAAEGGARRRLTDDAFIEGSPEWSRDGKRLAFHAAHPPEPARIWILDLADSRVTQVTREKGRTTNPAWSPDGSEIAYYGIASGDEQVWSIPAAGGAARRLTFHETQSWNACWSPDGKEIAFSGYRNVATGGSLFVMPRDGEGASCERSRALTRRTDHGWDRFPSWSPDGRWVAFTARGRDGNWDIWLVSADGRVEVRLTEDPAQDVEPSWAPDSRRLVFQSDRGGSNDLWILDAARWTSASSPSAPRSR